jgi:hypothetical protein
VAVLRPGEHPGDGAKVGQRLGAETARGARADIEQGDFFDPTRSLEILDEAGMGDEPSIGGARAPGRRLQDVVDSRFGFSASSPSDVSACSNTLAASSSSW